jgi:PAS domain S-box-containing protein
MLKGETVQSSTQGVSPEKIGKVEEKSRKTGIDVVGDAPFGTHFCLFYGTKEDLIDVLVPYFKAGLESNEFCMWVTSEPLSEEEAKEAMRRAVPNFDGYVERGQIEIVPYTEWYLKGGAFNFQRVLNGWVEKLNQALAKGYDGMRVTGNTAWLEKRDWRNFVDYEQEINRVIGKYRMIVICTYLLDKCVASEVIDVVRNHQFAVIKREGKCELIEDSEFKRSEEALTKSEEQYRRLVDSAPDGIMTFDMKGVVTSINPAFERLTGFSKDEIVGKHFTKLPTIRMKDVLKYLKLFSSFIRGKKIPPVEFPYRRKDGTICWGEAHPALLKEGGKNVGIQVILRDITERKRDEENLRQSEDKYRGLFDSTLDGIVVSDTEGVVVSANQAAAAMLGYKNAEELVNAPAVTLYGEPQDRRVLFELLAKKGTVKDYEVKLKKKDGKTFDVRATIVLQRDLQGNVLRAESIFRDITERKKAEMKLRESEEKYRNLAENSKDAIAVVDFKGNVLFANKAAERLTGYTLQEGKGMNIRVVTPKRLWLKSIAMLLKARLGKTIPYFEYELKKKDGTLISVETGGQAIFKDGKPVAIQIITRDITERKKAEETLRGSEEKWRSLAENAPNIITIVDRLGTIQFINRVVVDARPEEIVGRSICDFIGPEYHNVVKKTIEQVFQTGEGRSYEISGVGPKGSVSWYATQVGPIKQDGQIVSATLITTDITERKKMEKQLKEYSEHLEEKVEERTNQLKEAQEQLLKAEKLAAIGEVAAMVGHDLRNPLQVITNTLYTAEKKSKSSPITEKEILEKHGFLELRSGLKEQVEYMEKIVSDLQNYARPLKPKPVEIGLHQLIKKTLSSLTVPENVKVSIVVEKDFPKLMLDPTLMQRVFSNLTINAVQAMPNGGKLTIRASKKEETALISVEDTGAGISDANLSKIFTLLFTTKAKGQGFGLPVCKRMVEAHDGNITVESKVGKGSTFTVEIPLRKEVS